MPTATDLIKLFDLKKHPEGGYYKRIYESKDFVIAPELFQDPRLAITSIYYLLEGNDFSAFHRIKSDEIWHFYLGSSLTLYVIDEQGHLQKLILGNTTLEKDAIFQIIIPKNHWFAATVNDKNSFSFIGCVVAPGFDFKDFELASYENLAKQYPQHAELIKKLTLNSDSGVKA